jgi:hypothetical protein
MLHTGVSLELQLPMQSVPIITVVNSNPAVWYFGTVLTVWYVCLYSMTLCLQEAMTIRLICSCRSSPQTQVHSISVNKKYKYPNLQSVPIITVVNSNPAQARCTRDNIMS